jgi:hypothetical protein
MASRFHPRVLFILFGGGAAGSCEGCGNCSIVPITSLIRNLVVINLLKFSVGFKLLRNLASMRSHTNFSNFVEK